MKRRSEMGTIHIYINGYGVDAVNAIFCAVAEQASSYLGYPVKIHVMKKTWFHPHCDGIILSPGFANMQRQLRVPSLVVNISDCRDTAERFSVAREAVINLAQRASFG